MQLFLFLILFLAGVLSWTLAEYVIHRSLGHNKKLKTPFTYEHLKHHQETNYFAPTYKKALAAILSLTVFTLLLALVFTWTLSFAFSLGFTVMYVVYEVVHRRAHTHGPTHAYGRFVRMHHFFHHFKNPHVNHGVTSPLWDIVFGTLIKTDVVMVPKKLALPWMIDPNTGAIYEKYSMDYQLRGGSTAKV